MSASVCHVRDGAGLEFKTCLKAAGFMRSKKVECLAQGNSEWKIRELGDLSAFHYSKKHFPTSPKF